MTLKLSIAPVPSNKSIMSRRCGHASRRVVVVARREQTSGAPDGLRDYVMAFYCPT